MKGSLSPQKMGLGGVEVALPASLIFYNCIFFATLHYSGSPIPSLRKMGLGGVEVAVDCNSQFITTVFFWKLCILSGSPTLRLIRWGWEGWK